MMTLVIVLWACAAAAFVGARALYWQADESARREMGEERWRQYCSVASSLGPASPPNVWSFLGVVCDVATLALLVAALINTGRLP